MMMLPQLLVLCCCSSSTLLSSSSTTVYSSSSSRLWFTPQASTLVFPLACVGNTLGFSLEAILGFSLEAAVAVAVHRVQSRRRRCQNETKIGCISELKTNLILGFFLNRREKVVPIIN